MDWKQLIDKRIEEFIIIVTMALMVILMFTQSSSRFLLGSSLSWGSELARYLHVWQIWIGASRAVRSHALVRIDVFVNLFPRRVKFFLNFLAFLCWFTFAVFLAIEGSKYVANIFASGQTSPALNVPIGIPYLAVPIGGLFMSLRLIQQMYLLYKNYQGSSREEEIE